MVQIDDDINRLPLLQTSARQIPGAVHYTIQRFQKPAQELQEERGVLQYQYSKINAAENYLELRFCLTGNMYCKHATG